MLDLSDIRKAAARIDGAVHRTPLLSAAGIGGRVGVKLFLKCENLQKTGSFKPRGALNKVLGLTPGEQAGGICTVSAGNHAQAVAWAAKRVAAPCVVVMPANAPRAKVEAVLGYGAEIVFHDDMPTIFDRLERVRRERGAAFVHPFDDPLTLAGAGTTGLEILEDLPMADVVIVPVGGGGLMGGVAAAVKGMSPRTRVVAVELAEGPGLTPALMAGKPVPVSRPKQTLCDGMTPPFVGALPLEIARRCVDEIVAVTEEEVKEAMRLLLTRAKLCVEGAGAAATAALLAGRFSAPPGATVVSIVSGGNIDPHTLARVLNREATPAG